MWIMPFCKSFGFEKTKQLLTIQLYHYTFTQAYSNWSNALKRTEISWVCSHSWSVVKGMKLAKNAAILKIDAIKDM